MLFDRHYDPICRRRPDGYVELADRDEQITGIKSETFFWTDGKQRHGSAAARNIARICAEWGVA